MPGENGARPNGDRSEPEHNQAALDEIERGRVLDEERKAVREAGKVELDAAMKADGRALDLKAAHSRCFAAGTHDPEQLVNDERPG